MACGIGRTLSTPSVRAMSESAVQPWKVRNAEHMTVELELVDLGAVGAVPRVVGGRVAVEDVPEHLLVGGQQPALDRAGVGVRGQAAGAGAGCAAADAVGVGGVAVRVEPDPALRLVLARSC